VVWVWTAWLVVELLLYVVLVPEVLSLAAFVYLSVILVVLAGVVTVMVRRAEPEPSIEDVLYEVEHEKGPGTKP
jgi:hypothetical protein